MAKKLCPFCEIVAGRAPAYIVDQDESSLALLDINPLAEGHTLIISRRHVVWWDELTEDEMVSVFRMARRVAHRLKRAFSPDSVCMYARSRLHHMHVGLLPTVKGDVLDGFFNALERVQESAAALAELKSRDALSRAKKKIRA